MAFNGYMIKTSQGIFPLAFVYADSYKIAPKQRMDLDSFRDANGELNRTVLEHRPSKITFSTVPMYNDKLKKMNDFLRNSFSVESERKLTLEYYCPDTDSYSTGEFYMPDMTYPIDMVDLDHNRILYGSFTIEFIEY